MRFVKFVFNFKKKKAMKKIYVNPQTEIVEIHSSNLLQIGSVEVKNSKASSEYETLSREGGFFDDEDF